VDGILLPTAKNEYITRNEFARLITTVFADELIDYRYLYGNNHMMYRWILRQLPHMSSHEQKQFIDALTRRLAGVDSEKMLVKY
jgi:hypothetical protein